MSMCSETETVSMDSMKNYMKVHIGSIDSGALGSSQHHVQEMIQDQAIDWSEAPVHRVRMDFASQAALLEVHQLGPPDAATQTQVACHCDGQDLIVELLGEFAQESTWRLFKEVVGAPSEKPSHRCHWSEEKELHFQSAAPLLRCREEPRPSRMKGSEEWFNNLMPKVEGETHLSQVVTYTCNARTRHINDLRKGLSELLNALEQLGIHQAFLHICCICCIWCQRQMQSKESGNLEGQTGKDIRHSDGPCGEVVAINKAYGWPVQRL